MEHRRLGRSGLKISEITYGNWLTHGSRSTSDAAAACVHAALDEGITTFDTADVYAGGRAESALGKALKGQRREGIEVFSKVYWPTGDGLNDRGLSRKHIIESCEASLKRLGTDYLDVYQAHRYDYETPLDEVLRAFDDLIRQGKVLYVGVSEWKASQISDAVAHAARFGYDRFVSSQPEYSMLWRVIEEEVVPTSEELGLSQIVWSPMAQGVLTGKYLPGQAHPAGSRATSRGRGDHGGLPVRRRPHPGAGLSPSRRRRAVDGSAGVRLGPAERQRGSGDRRRVRAPSRSTRTPRPPAYASTTRS